MKLNISEIKAIGEFTTSDGPFIDDWFLTFITQTDWIEIPMYTHGMTEFLVDLGKVLDSDLRTKLANSGVWNTRIIYPTEFRESVLFEIEFIEPKTFYEKFKKWIGMQDNVRVYSNVLKKIIKE